MVKTAISAFPREIKKISGDKTTVLHIAECFGNTVQGEGISAGVPSIFLRMQNCTLNCTWCDTTEVWRRGNPYSVEELLSIWKFYNIDQDLRSKHHLVITGGSPLLQQQGLTKLFKGFVDSLSFTPFIEVENECVRMPDSYFLSYISQWNNSPKLSNSGMKKSIRYKPDIIKFMSGIYNSYFKFVISEESDWDEIEKDFLMPDLIKKEQIILMPEGSSREELRKAYTHVLDLCCKHGVRMSDRLQVTVFDKVVGV